MHKLEALEKLRTEAPDIILLDVSMPGQGGLHACRSIRAISPARMIPGPKDGRFAGSDSAPEAYWQSPACLDSRTPVEYL
jgi:CheY-like chemotaxis protein